MSVVVKKSALVGLMKKLATESRSFHSANIAEIPAKAEDDSPIVPSEEMSIQLSTAMPPVEDPDYKPTSKSDLSLAAKAIAQEVPKGQINFFYRGLHRLLDLSYDRAHPVKKINEMLEILREAMDQDDNESSDDDQDLPAEQGREYHISSAIDNIVKKIIDNKLHLIELPGEPIIDYATGEKRQPKVIAGQDSISYVMNRALELDIVKQAYDEAIKSLKISPAIFMTMVQEEVLGYLGKEGPAVDNELGAEMNSNTLADKLWKEAQVEAAEDGKATMNSEIVAMLRKLADKKKEETRQSNKGLVKFSIPDIGNFEISFDKWVIYFDDAIEDVISRNVSGKDPMFSSPEDDEDDDKTEALSKEEVQEIRKKIREETLASEFEPGKLNLSQESIRAITEKISKELGLKYGNVRNILYDDLIASGMDNEVMRKIFGLRRMPRGRKSISLLYDPLKIKAEEMIDILLIYILTKEMKMTHLPV